jgi:hypothetical protein
MLSSVRNYEQFIYTLPQRYPWIRQSTLVLIMHGPAFGELTGRLIFDGDIHLEVWEDLDFDEPSIQGYSYAVNRAGERLYWYDPQPHPHIPELADNHPHHKHVPPNIKRNRITAPELSFSRPNLPYLLEEIKRELLSESDDV